MAEDGVKKEGEGVDFIQPMGFDIDPNKYSLEQLEKVVKKGFIIEGNADKGKARVVGRIVIKGKKDKEDVSA